MITTYETHLPREVYKILDRHNYLDGKSHITPQAAHQNGLQMRSIFRVIPKEDRVKICLHAEIFQNNVYLCVEKKTYTFKYRRLVILKRGTPGFNYTRLFSSALQPDATSSVVSEFKHLLHTVPTPIEIEGALD